MHSLFMQIWQYGPKQTHKIMQEFDTIISNCIFNNDRNNCDRFKLVLNSTIHDC